MLFRKKKKPSTQAFARIFPTRWLLEYGGVLPHCTKQGVTIAHHLCCRRLNSGSTPDTPTLLMETGLQTNVPATATHELWCFCRLAKDHGDVRLLFRQYVDLKMVDDPDRQDWIATRLMTHLHNELIKSTDFRFLIRCNSRREYLWCAKPLELDAYWDSEVRSKVKGLMGLMKR